MLLDRDRTFELTLEKLPTAPEAVLRDAEKSAAEDRAAQAKLAAKRRQGPGRRVAPKKIVKKKREKKSATMKARRKVDSVRTIDPFE